MNIRFPEVERLQGRFSPACRLKPETEGGRRERPPVFHDLDVRAPSADRVAIAPHRRSTDPRRAVFPRPARGVLGEQAAGSPDEGVETGPVVEGGEELTA